jgi:hypothetical protein
LYNSKNYSTDGGDKLVIGGTLQIEQGAKVIGLDNASNKLDFQANSTATTVKELIQDFNKLLANLQNANMMNKS